MESRVFAASLLGFVAALAVTVPAAARDQGRGTAGQLIKQWDPDKDGTLDWAEVKNAAISRFKQLDADRDGTLDRKEAAKAGITKDEFAKANPDKDATLDQNEYLSIVEQRFKAANPDNDSTIEETELETPAGKALARMLAGPRAKNTASAR